MSEHRKILEIYPFFTYACTRYMRGGTLSLTGPNGDKNLYPEQILYAGVPHLYVFQTLLGKTCAAVIQIYFVPASTKVD